MTTQDHRTDTDEIDLTDRAAGTEQTDEDTSTDLFDDEDATLFRERWQLVQTRFVDDPRGAVRDADALVSEVTQSLTSHFAEQRTSLESQWSSGDDVDTEALRVAIRRYRSLFERLLSA
jgi:hypothetical protein